MAKNEKGKSGGSGISYILCKVRTAKSAMVRGSKIYRFIGWFIEWLPAEDLLEYFSIRF